jgi:DNA repair protein RadC
MVLMRDGLAEESEIGLRQKLREDFVLGEPNALTDEALLELLLSYALSRGNPEPLARKLIQEFGRLDNVLSSDFDTLCRVKGVKSYTATLLKLTGYLRANGIAKDQQSGPFSGPQQSLIEFQSLPDQKPISPSQKEKPLRKTNIARHRSELFTNSVLKEAIEILPRLPDTEDIGVIRAFLKENLPFSGQNTRDRYVPYIVNRLFPDGKADKALRSFARIYPGSQELRDACFYRFCKAEPLMFSICSDLLIPAVGYGRLDRSMMREYLASRHPSSEVIDLSAQAIIKSLVAGGVAKSDRKKISFGYRHPSMTSLAFVIHSELPRPGMYEISSLEQNPAIRAMLWNPDKLLPGLYELRNQGILAKVSEIDRFRQFTTKYTLEELVDSLGSVLVGGMQA